MDEEVNELINYMKETALNPGLKDVAENDALILAFGKSLLGRLGTSEEQRRKDKDNIRTKVRTVARLLVKLNENSEVENLPLSDYISGKNSGKSLKL